MLLPIVLLTLPHWSDVHDRRRAAFPLCATDSDEIVALHEAWTNGHSEAADQKCGQINRMGLVCSNLLGRTGNRHRHSRP